MIISKGVITINFKVNSMGYATKLQRQFDGLAALTGGTLQKRRDKLNRAGVHHKVETASFSTHVKGTEKRKGSSKPPRPL